MAAKRPLIIPIFIPHAGCPHRCAFCDQTQISGVKQGIPSPENLLDQARRFLSYRGKRRTDIQIAFYGGNFLGLPEETLRPLLQAAARLVATGQVDGIRFSTRPDSVSPEKLSFLRNFPIATVELGVQSMDDRVLARSRRGHGAAHTVHASRLLREEGYEVGMQIMPGLPGDDEATSLDTARRVAGLSPAFVRIYPTVVFDGSLLAQWYREGSYSPLSLSATVNLVKKQVLLFTKEHIRVIRVGIPVTQELLNGAGILAGPLHPALGDLVWSEILLDAATRQLSRISPIPARISIRVHPTDCSRMRGHGGRNIQFLKTRFALSSIEIVPDSDVVVAEPKIAAVATCPL